jgi:hypothetical protein
VASFDHPSRGNIVVARPYFARQVTTLHPKDAAPAWGERNLGPKSTGRKVPHIGTILMWVRNPPIPIKFCFKKTDSGLF